MDADILIVGAGVMGCSIAYSLARTGRSVVVLDKGPAAGAGSTSSSSAIIRFHYSTLDGVVAAWEAKHLWSQWEEFLGGSDESGLARFYQPGALIIDPPGSGRKERVTALFDKVGVPYEELDADQIAGRYPALDTGKYWPPSAVDDERFWAEPNGRIEAYLTPDAGFVDDPQLAAHNLMVAAQRHGAIFRFGCQVVRVETAGGRVTGVELADGERLSCGVLVNAAGPFSSRLNTLAGVIDDFESVSTRALRQEVHVLPAPAGFGLDDGGVVVNDADLGTYFRPQPGGTIVVGGIEPECDPLVWIDDPDDYNPNATVSVSEAQSYRTARRIPSLSVPTRPVGLAALYDVTPDWVPIYDRTSLDGYYVAIGTSGNQFKNAPLVGRLMTTMIDACEGGHDHDASPLRFDCEMTGLQLDLGHFSRLRTLAETTNSVLG